VHLAMRFVDMDALVKLAAERKILIIEDCAHAHGAQYKGRGAGSIGDIGCFSFQSSKIMTAGEGGCVVTNNFQLHQRAVACHDLGYARDENGRMIFDNPDLRLWGRGYRLDELRAAVLRVQLKKRPRIIKAMHQSKYRIRKALEKFARVR